MEYTLKDGFVVGDAYFEQLAAAAEHGDYPGKPGEWVVRSKGRPQIYGEDLVSVTVRIPKSLRDAIDRKAESLDETRSEYLRDLVARDLAITA